MKEIRKVAVVGSGVMGSGIAAQIANAGVPVVLLDIVPANAPDTESRSTLSEQAKARMVKARPAPLMHPDVTSNIVTGNLEDDAGLLADCDWICEAVVENVDIKQALYKTIENHRKPGSIVTSNTSTIPVSRLTDGLTAQLRRDFAVTHFFNPPRYMRLLELVAAQDTCLDVIDCLNRFCDRSLGKEVVACKDTPGFIANRIGVFWMAAAVNAAFKFGLTVEQADAVAGKPMGVPATGVFGLLDLTGIDLFPPVLQTLSGMLPETDLFQTVCDPKSALNECIVAMLGKGLIGRKGGGGFYRAARDGDRRVTEALDLDSGAYRPLQTPALDSLTAAAGGGLKALVDHPDKGGRFARETLVGMLTYATALIPEIADDPQTIDIAMKTGYGWKWGPFELLDLVDVNWLRDQIAARSLPMPPFIERAGGGPVYRYGARYVETLDLYGAYKKITPPQDAWTLADRKRGQRPLAHNPSASIWDIGDAVACLELHSKMNTIDDHVLEMMCIASELKGRGLRALVIGSDAPNFSVGVNLTYVSGLIEGGSWNILERFVRHGQTAMTSLKMAPFPVVSAIAGHVLGGGCEIALHSDAIQAHAETYMGLVETKVGIIPAWGGCKELLLRANAERSGIKGPTQPSKTVFEKIASAATSTSALDARKLGFLRASDGISMNRSRLLADAKSKALGLADDYQVPELQELNLPGPTCAIALKMTIEAASSSGAAAAHDIVVGTALSRVLTGGDTDMMRPLKESDVLDLECQGFMQLARTDKTLERMKHLLSDRK